MNRWNACALFRNRYGMRRNSKAPKGVVITVFGMSSEAMVEGRDEVESGVVGSVEACGEVIEVRGRRSGTMMRLRSR